MEVPQNVMRRRVSLAFLLLLVGVSRASAETFVYEVDPASSRVHVHVGRAGLFGFAGHEHEVLATDFQGRVLVSSDDWSASSLELRFASAGLEVDPAKESPEDLVKVQEAMQSARCLDVSTYPEISFRSTRTEVTEQGDDGTVFLRLTGELSLHNVTRELTFPVEVRRTEADLVASGTVEIRQKHFGIKPSRLLRRPGSRCFSIPPWAWSLSMNPALRPEAP